MCISTLYNYIDYFCIGNNKNIYVELDNQKKDVITVIIKHNLTELKKTQGIP